MLLLTNDDGYRARGLRALADAVQNLDDLVIVAPLGNRSGIGHTISFKEVRVQQRLYAGREMLTLSSSPSDCASYGLEALLPRPEYVLSGVNRGTNSGMSLYMSGTIAAARQAAILGVPGIAVSAAGFEDPDYDLAAAFGREFFLWLRAAQVEGCYFNLVAPKKNLPRQGVAVTRPSLDKDLRSRWELQPSGKYLHRTEWLPSTERWSYQWALDRGYLTLTVNTLDRDCARAEALEERIFSEFRFAGLPTVLPAP